MCRTSTQNKGRYGPRSKARLGLFSPKVTADRVREQRSGAASGSPPLSARVCSGGAKRPSASRPPAGRASALAGDPSPWPAPAAFNVRRPGMAAARTAATLFKGGRCGGLLADINSQRRQHCGQRQGVRPLCASDSPWARPGVRTGRAGNLRPASAPPVTVLGFSPPAPPLGG